MANRPRPRVMQFGLGLARPSVGKRSCRSWRCCTSASPARSAAPPRTPRSFDRGGVVFLGARRVRREKDAPKITRFGRGQTRPFLTPFGFPKRTPNWIVTNLAIWVGSFGFSLNTNQRMCAFLEGALLCLVFSHAFHWSRCHIVHLEAPT